MNIYRTIGDGEASYLVERVNVGITKYIDALDDIKVVINRQLDFSKLALPPLQVNQNGHWNTVGGKYLTEEDGTFYLAYKDRVYLSLQDNPHGWDPSRYLTFDGDITGIAAEDRGVIVFTANRSYHVTGTTIADINRRWIPNYQGCPNWRTITYMSDMPLWLSYDGLTQFGYQENISVERITVLTEKKFTWPENIKFGVAANDIYYAFTDDGEVVCMDFRRDGVIYKRTLDADAAVYDEANDRLIIRKSGQNYIVGTGDALEYDYVSPDLNFQTKYTTGTEPKRIRSLYIHATDTVEVTVYVDGEAKFTGESAGMKDRRLFVSPGLVGEFFRFGLKSKGEIKRISIEYTQMQNQR